MFQCCTRTPEEDDDMKRDDAVAVVRQAIDGRRGTKAEREAAHAALDALLEPPEIVGAAEACEICDVASGNLGTLVGLPDPPDGWTLAMGAVRLRSDVERYAAERRRRGSGGEAA